MAALGTAGERIPSDAGRRRREALRLQDVGGHDGAEEGRLRGRRHRHRHGQRLHGHDRGARSSSSDRARICPSSNLQRTPVSASDRGFCMSGSTPTHIELADFRTGVLFCSQQTRVEKTTGYAQDRTPFPDPAPQPRRGPALPADASAFVAAAGAADKAGILDFIRHVGCIQYDPVNLVGQTPSWCGRRAWPITRPRCLPNCSILIGGWWTVGQTGGDPSGRGLAVLRPTSRAGAPRARRPGHPPMAIAAAVTDAIRDRGPLCSADLGHHDTIDWWWGVPTRLGRAALEILYGMGELGVHHRITAALLRPDRAARPPLFWRRPTRPDRRGVRGLARRAPRRIAGACQPGRGRILAGHGRDEG